MHTLQNVIFPKLDGCTEESLYFRLNDRAQYCYEEQAITLSPGGEANFNTYFNQFSVNRWGRFTDMQDIALELHYHGAGNLSVEIDLENHSPRIVCQQQLSSTEQSKVIIELPKLTDLEAGLVSLKLESKDHLKMLGARYVTPTPAVRPVKLGIVITAFRRDANVIAATHRLHRDLLDNTHYREQLALTVVDNGSTLNDSDLPGSCKLIPNRNLGGAGGFSRGLYYYKEEREDITHCLFMDDDASCESESIIRTLALLSYSNQGDTAIAGAMLLERLAWKQHESGAYFNMRCVPLKTELDLRAPGDLRENDRISPFGYGAWWYFAFPLGQVEKYPFPFFVRGDDVLFSMTNIFRLVTLNGVASWQDSFLGKRSPLTLYLDMRSHIYHYVLADRLNFSVFRIMVMFWHFFLKHNLSCHYGSAMAQCVALEDTMRPPAFWVDNIDMSNKRDELSILLDKEKPGELSDASGTIYDRADEPFLRKILRGATLNGHMLPRILFKSAVTIPKTPGMLRAGSFAAKTVYVDCLDEKSIYTLRHSKLDFFHNLARATQLSIRFVLHSRSLKSRKEELETFMTAEFWQQQCNIDKQSGNA